jgi:hypothetical protein
MGGGSIPMPTTSSCGDVRPTNARVSRRSASEKKAEPSRRLQHLVPQSEAQLRLEPHVRKNHAALRRRFDAEYGQRVKEAKEHQHVVRTLLPFQILDEAGRRRALHANPLELVGARRWLDLKAARQGGEAGSIAVLRDGESGG